MKKPSKKPAVEPGLALCTCLEARPLLWSLRLKLGRKSGLQWSSPLRKEYIQKPVVLRTLLIIQLTIKTLCYVNKLCFFFAGDKLHFYQSSKPSQTVGVQYN